VNPIVVHVVRPYATDQDYLAAEAWTIDARSMLLVDAEPLPADTTVLFDISLEDGSKLIRAEGRVLAPVAPLGGRPGGLRVRFKRFGATTKAFIERAVKLRSGLEPERPSQREPERPSMTDLERPSMTDLERPSMTALEQPSMTPPERPGMTALEQAEPERSSRTREAPPPERSGTRQRAHGPVTAPHNREELLARLRHRRQTA
jgi:hypothetical protein